MKILITGSRYWDDTETIVNVFKQLPSNTVIVHGGAKGADGRCGYVAYQLGFKVKIYQALWHIYGDRAGIIRNQLMLDDNPDISCALAFHDNLNGSKGTKDMVARLTVHGIPYKVITSKKKRETENGR